MVGTVRAFEHAGLSIVLTSSLVGLVAGGCSTACQEDGFAGGSCAKSDGAISGGGGNETASGPTGTDGGSGGGTDGGSDEDAKGSSGGMDSGVEGSGTAGGGSGSGESTSATMGDATAGPGSTSGAQPPSPTCVGDFNVTQAVASGHHAGCDAATASNWTDCAAAASRYCQTVFDPGCGTASGFAAEFDGVNDAMSVTCAAGESFQVDYAALAGQHESCTGASATFPDMYGIFCNSAIHRYCQAVGYASGFGPVEVGLPTAYVHCLAAEHATVVSVPIAALASQHAGCDDPINDLHACQAASRRHCIMQGHRGGYGPVEAGASGVAIVCVG